MNYVTNLNVHSDYELAQSLIKIDSYIDFAKKNSLKAIALTDDSIMSGVIEFYKKAVKNDIKPLIGVEFNICKEKSEIKRKRTLSQILLFAKNNEGFKNLIQLSNYANSKGKHEKFRIDIDVLRKYSEGLICVTYELLPNKTSKQLIEQIKKYKNIFGEDMYIGLNEDELNLREEHILELINISKKLKIKPVITSETRYFRNDEFSKFDALYSENLDKKRDNKEYLWGYFHYRSKSELKKIYHYLCSEQFNEYLSNIDEIVQKCNVDLEKFYDFPKLPKFKTPKDYNSQEYLEELVKKGITERYPKFTDEIKNRYEYELQIIKEKNLADYFLIVLDYINYAIRNNIPYMCRGYAPGSIVCYALKITHIDPIENNLFFERFLNPNTETLPDINIDCGHPEIKNLVNYINNKYEDQTANVLTYTIYSPITAFMWSCRLHDIPHSECMAFRKMLKSLNITSLKDVFKIKSSKFKKLYDENYLITAHSGEKVSLKKIVDNAICYEGLKREKSIHIAGIIVSRKNLGNDIPIEYDRGKELTTQYSKGALDSLGYVKFDIIPSVYISFFNNIANKADVNLLDLPLDDNKAFELIKKGETKDTFALCSDDCISYLKKLKPDNIEQLCAFLSLYRKKPVQTGLMKEYIERKNGKDFEYLHPSLKPILEETYGILIYEEQVIEIIRLLTGCTSAEADILRNNIKQGVFDKKSFVNTLVKDRYDKAFANDIAKVLSKDGSFAFSKSHVIGLARQTYYQAYLKAHYPQYFDK